MRLVSRQAFGDGGVYEAKSLHSWRAASLRDPSSALFLACVVTYVHHVSQWYVGGRVVFLFVFFATTIALEINPRD